MKFKVSWVLLVKCRVLGLSCLGLVVSWVCRVLGRSCLGLVVSWVGRVLGLSVLGLSVLGLSRLGFVCLGFVGVPTHGLYCRNAKPNNSLDCKYSEVSMNKALVSEQTLLELNLF